MARDEGRKDERTKKGTRLIAVLSFHDVTGAALKAASFETSSSWRSMVPLRIGEPEAPVPYFRVASIEASITSGR